MIYRQDPIETFWRPREITIDTDEHFIHYCCCIYAYILNIFYNDFLSILYVAILIHFTEQDNNRKN